MAGSAVVGALRVLFSGNTAEFDAAMQKAAKSTQKYGGAAKKASQDTGIFSGSVAKLAGAMSAAALITGAVTALVSWGREAIASAGNIVDLAAKTGLTTETIQRMAFVAQQTSSDINAFTTAAFNLGVRLSGGGSSVVAALDKMGLSLSALRAMNPDQQWDATTRALGNMTNAQDRNNAGMALMGKTFKDVAPAIEQGYGKLADGANVASQAQLEAVDEASEAWSNFVANQKTNITTLLGSIVLGAQQATEAEGTYWNQQHQMAERSRADFAAIGSAWDVLTNKLGQPLTPASPFAGLISSTSEITKGLALPSDLEEINEALKQARDAQIEAGKAADAHAKALKALSDELSGQGLLKHVGEMVTEIEKLGGVTHLTRSKQDEINKALANAIEIYAALGETAPKALLDIYTATMPLIPATQGWGTEILTAMRNIGMEEPIATAGIGNIAAAMQTLDIHTEAAGIEAGLLTGAYQAFGIQTQAELQTVADAAVIHFTTLRDSGTATPRDIQYAFEQMRDAVNAANGTIPSVWEVEVLPRIQGAMSSLQGSFTSTLASMITQQQGWKDGAISIWESFKSAVANILSSLLNTFTNTFLKGMLNAITGAQGGFTGAFANMLGGGGGGAGGWIGLLTGGGGAGAAGAGAAAAGGVLPSTALGTLAPVAGGIGAGAAVATTAGIAGAALLAWAIWKKGLFRGGEEALHVNPARDAYLQQYEMGGMRQAPGVGTNTGMSSLAAQLTAATGIAGGGPLMDAIFNADTVKEFQTAIENVEAALEEYATQQEELAAATKATADEEQVAADERLASIEEEKQARIDAAQSQVDTAQATVDQLATQFDTLAQSIADEVEEAEIGVIEQQVRNQMDALALQQEAAQQQLATAQQALHDATAEDAALADTAVDDLATTVEDTGTTVETVAQANTDQMQEWIDRGINPSADAMAGVIDRTIEMGNTIVDQAGRGIAALQGLKYWTDGVAEGFSPGGFLGIRVRAREAGLEIGGMSEEAIRAMVQLYEATNHVASAMHGEDWKGYAHGADWKGGDAHGLDWRGTDGSSTTSRTSVGEVTIVVNIGDGVNPMDRPSLEAAIRDGVRGASRELVQYLQSAPSARGEWHSTVG